MKITFRQGIVAYQSTGLIQSFLAKTGVYVSLQTVNADTVVAFAHGGSNYLLTEAADVANAWGPIPVSTDAWLFWDIDLQTGVRTFGFTLIEPTSGTEFPVSPVQGQHFFDLDDTTMYLFDLGGWRPVVRVFAAKVNNATFTALGSGFASKPFSGTQVGLFANVSAGHILFDEVQAPIRRSNGEFFTTDSDIFTASAPATTIRIEASVLSATALENLAAYQVVFFSQFGKINAAEYNDLQEEAIGIVLEGLLINQTGTVILQGAVTNPAWTWTTVGAPLWIDDTGALTETDPHVSPGPTFYPVGKPPIARVITPTTIIFDQGLGAKGDTGEPGPQNLATDAEFGAVRLSVPAAFAIDPVVVGDNDPRFDTFVLKAGDTMTGFLTLNADPTAALHAATKQYVDAVAGGVVEPANQLIYGTGVGVDSDADLTWNPTTHILSLGSVATPATIRSPDGIASAGANLSLIAGAGVGTDQDGGNITITAGARTGTGIAGVINLVIPATGELQINGDGGTVGQVLTSNGPGVAPTWQAGGGGGGAYPDNEIAFGSGGGTSSSSDPDFTYVAATGRLWVNTTDGSTTSVSVAVPGGVAIFGGDSTGVSDGGKITLVSGNGSGTGGNGGEITITGGSGDDIAIGGAITIEAGPGGTTGGGTGGGLTLRAGSAQSDDADGGTVELSAGQGSGINGGGPIFVTAGSADNGIGGFVSIVGGDSNTSNGGDAVVYGGFTNDTVSKGGATVIGGGQNSATPAISTGVHLVSANFGQATNNDAWDDSIVSHVSKGTYQTAGDGETGFNAIGSARAGVYVLRIHTTDDTPDVEMFIGASPNVRRMVVPDDSTWHFEIKIVARRTDADDESAAYKYEGCIDNNAGTTALVGAVTETIVVEDDPDWSVTVDADAGNNALCIRVTGEAAKEINWVAFVRTVETTG